ncbi:TrmH family RNA methyltransferase [Mediterraneibacter massiliensis]|uniref:TrmH family RNA methyltransferase n=1 Tax=Mediterraneibacter massiliensis TaxID=1720300 RepID=UPI000E52CF53|nr:RNA methyltransferase [Mediterraneibacter massiliensis]RGT70999.1 RNA methyltransferase [Ruminococcus sp. AF18-22]
MITSTGNQKVKELIQLQKKSKIRNNEGVFIAEGSRIVREMPAERIKSLYVAESWWKQHKKEMEELQKKPEILSDPVFAHVSDTKSPQGILAVVRQMAYDFSDITGIKQGKKAHILVLDNLQDPGNLGTIFRTAEAAGATGILLSADCVDIYNPKVIRSTMGAVCRVPFYYAKDICGEIRKLKQEKIKIYAAHLEGIHEYDGEDYRDSCAFLIGNEGNGLKEEVAACADVKVRIPMQGKAESLNAAVASAILMFEAGRQRRKQR